MKNGCLLLIMALGFSVLNCLPGQAQGYYGMVRMLPMVLSPIRQMANGSYKNKNNNNNGQNGNGQNGNNQQPAYDWRNNYPNGPANYNGGQGANGMPVQGASSSNANGQYMGGNNQYDSNSGSANNGQYGQPNQTAYGNQPINGKHQKHSKNKKQNQAQNQTAYQNQTANPYQNQNYNQQNTAYAGGSPAPMAGAAPVTTAQSNLYGQLNPAQTQGYGMPSNSMGEQMGPMPGGNQQYAGSQQSF